MATLNCDSACTVPREDPATRNMKMLHHTKQQKRRSWHPFCLRITSASTTSSLLQPACRPTSSKDTNNASCSMLCLKACRICTNYITLFESVQPHVSFKGSQAFCIQDNTANSGIRGVLQTAPIYLINAYSFLEGRSAKLSSLGTRSSHKFMLCVKASVHIAWINAL